MIFNGIEKNSLIEWPGKISTVLFLGGCSFRCPFCYNRGLVLDYQKLPVLSEKKVLAFLSKRKKFLDGVMITGGEPLQNKKLKIKDKKYKLKTENSLNQLIEFIKKVRKMGLGAGIETNGSNPTALKKLIDQKLIDYVAMDIKAPLGAKTQNSKFKTQNRKTKYEELTGVKVDLKKIKKSINLIKKSGLDYEFRTTVAPLLTEEDILEIAKELKGVKKFVLQVFRPVDSLIDPRLAKMKFFAKEDLAEISLKIKNNFGKFEIRG